MDVLPLVSIIVPVYKTKKYLKECIDSCIHQTYKNIEILCIDDCSPDESGRFCDVLSKADNRIKVKHLTKNVGLSGARNAGLNIARGEFVFFLDSDDFLSLDAVEKCMKIAKTHPVDIVLFNAEMFTDETKFLALQGMPYESVGGLVTVSESSFLASYVNAPFCMFSLDFVNKNKLRFYEGIFNEDWEFLGHCFSLADKAYILNEPFYHYRWSVSGSISTIASPKMLDIFLVLRLVKSYYIESKQWQTKEFAHLYRALKHLLWLCSDKCDYISNPGLANDFIRSFHEFLNDKDLHPLLLSTVFLKFSKKEKKILYLAKNHPWALSLRVIKQSIRRRLRKRH